jgi:hypothetical protein
MRKILFLAVFLSGCVAGGPSEREIMLGQLIGRPESQAVRQLGVPSRSFETDGKRFLAYTEDRLDVMPGMVGFARFGRPYSRVYGAFGHEIVQRSCETTLEIADGKVAGFTLRGTDCR